MAEALEKIKNFLLDVLIPKKCFGCGKEGEYVCQKCRVFLGEAPLICPVCQKPSFGGQRHEYCSLKEQLEGLISIWEYQGMVKKLIKEIKYNNVTDAIPFFLKISLETMIKDTARFSLFFSFICEKPVITFVPMHKEKEKKRRFNQAELIACELGKITNLEVSGFLKKNRETESQVKLEKEKRLENVKDAFSILSEENIPENLILVDDVWTSGATMKECCKILKKAGVKKVLGFTLSRTV